MSDTEPNMGNEESTVRTMLSRRMPWKGTAVAVFCVLFMILAGPVRPLPGLCWLSIAQFIIAALFIPFMFWALAFAIDLRHAPRAWRFGSLALLSVFAMSSIMANAKRWEWQENAVRADWDQAVRQLQGLDRAQHPPALSSNPDAGPFTRMSIVLSNRLVTDKLAYDEASRRAGLYDVDADGWKKMVAALRDCDKIAGLEHHANAVADRALDHVDEVRRMAAAAVERRDLDEAAARYYVQYVEWYVRTDIWRGEGAAKRELAAACRILDHSSWTEENGRIHFKRREDGLEFLRAYGRFTAATEELIEMIGRRQNPRT